MRRAADSGPAAAVLERPAVVGYRLHQRFRYDYDGPATDLVHRLVVVPPEQHGDQRLCHAALRVSEPTARISWSTGGHGARIAVIRVAQLPTSLQMSVDVLVERGSRQAHTHQRMAAGLLRSTPLTRPSAALRAVAQEHAGAEPAAVAQRLCTAVHERIAYAPGTTTVRTTAAQAWAQRSGVCQDQAHAMLALCRQAGLASRYVSGHLLGQGGTHAWVEVQAGDRVLGFDPCHDRRLGDPADGYVTVAVGRDYSDVPPTSGWYCGSARGSLTAQRLLTVA